MELNNKRDYDCWYYQMNTQGKLIKVDNNACWLGVNGPNFKLNIQALKKSIYNPYDIYIDKFKESHVSDKDRKRLIFLLNTITPCKIVKIEKKEYLKFTLIREGQYLPNLILLNFIRKMWYCTNYMRNAFDIEQFFKDIHKRRKRNEDVLSFLLQCTINNTKKTGVYGDFGGHNIVVQGMVTKTVHQLMNDNITRCNEWLKTN